jgi:hypothetical protein
MLSSELKEVTGRNRIRRDRFRGQDRTVWDWAGEIMIIMHIDPREGHFASSMKLWKPLVLYRVSCSLLEQKQDGAHRFLSILFVIL